MHSRIASVGLVELLKRLAERRLSRNQYCDAVSPKIIAVKGTVSQLKQPLRFVFRSVYGFLFSPHKVTGGWRRTYISDLPSCG
jgi:hypothetical protein